MQDAFGPDDIEVFVGIDMANGDHYAQAISRDGVELFHGAVANDEAAIVAVIERASVHGRTALIVDQPASGAQLLLAIAAERRVPVAYVTGLQFRVDTPARAAATMCSAAGCPSTSPAYAPPTAPLRSAWTRGMPCRRSKRQV